MKAAARNLSGPGFYRLLDIKLRWLIFSLGSNFVTLNPRFLDHRENAVQQRQKPKSLNRVGVNKLILNTKIERNGKC